MKKLLLPVFIAIFLFSVQNAAAQEIRKLTFEEVIKLSEEQSPNALMAKHRFRSSYWQYRTFVAQYRPSLTLTGSTPDYSTAFSRVWNSQDRGMGLYFNKYPSDHWLSVADTKYWSDRRVQFHFNQILLLKMILRRMRISILQLL